MIRESNHKSIDELLQDREGMDRAVQSAVRAALRRHMLLGESVAVLDENKKVKILDPEMIRKSLENTTN